MNVLIIYDSIFGNTEQIAFAIRDSFTSNDTVAAVRAAEFEVKQLEGIDLLFVGSPTRAFQPTKEVAALINSLPINGLNGVKTAVFDTRMTVADTNSRIYGFFAGLFGYATDSITKKLKKKGGQPVVHPEGFAVKGAEGPLKDGERERAQGWAKAAIYV